MHSGGLFKNSEKWITEISPDKTRAYNSTNRWKDWNVLGWEFIPEAV